jgi:SAM-dependent methyltransferase
MDGRLDARLESSCTTAESALPDYLVKNYWWAYLTPASLFVFDNPVFLTALLWGNLPRLVRSACSEFDPGSRVLQAANAYGNLATELAETVGPDGRLDVIDIAPLQAEHVRRKLAPYPQARVRVADAAAPGGGLYDGVCCFFLLHEIPDDHKRAVVSALLDSVAPGGKMVFVDYHKAPPLHPLRGPMGLIFRWFEPYASGLLECDIVDFASNPTAFTWRKETIFGGLYQKVVAERR